MMRTACAKWIIGAAALAAAPMTAMVPAAAQEPTAQSDFSCYVLISQRRAAITQMQIDAAQKNEILYNLDMIASFYRGRISQLSVDGALQMYQRARGVVAGLTPEQLDAQARNCATFYEGVNGVTARLEQGIDPAAP